MSVTVDWGQKIIHIPKSFMTLIQADPEVRELNLNDLRVALKDLEDNEAGMTFPDTHEHTPPTTISGITYARFVKIFNGYLVQFENGTYTVNCTGANHNLGDVKIANYVSLSINNSAGLQGVTGMTSEEHGWLRDLAREKLYSRMKNLEYEQIEGIWRMTAGDLVLFANKTDADADQNPVGTIDFVATYDVQGRATLMKRAVDSIAMQVGDY